MCVIIEKKADQNLPDAHVLAAARRNPDGMGMMYVKNGVLRRERAMPKSRTTVGEEFLEMWKRMEGQHVAFHLRIKTHGTTDVNNCHPFKVLTEKEHGKNLYMMHNGIINKIKIRDAKDSDTAEYAKHWLRPILSKDPSLLDTRSFRFLVENHIGASKLLFMDDAGTVWKYGDWEEHKGLAVSNTHFVPYENKTYGYNYVGGAYRSKQDMTKKARETWFYNWNHYDEEQEFWVNNTTGAISSYDQRDLRECDLVFLSENEYDPVAKKYVPITKEEEAPTTKKGKKSKKNKNKNKKTSSVVPLNTTKTLPAVIGKEHLDLVEEMQKESKKKPSTEDTYNDTEADDDTELLSSLGVYGVGANVSKPEDITVEDLQEMEREEIERFCEDEPDLMCNLVCEMLYEMKAQEEMYSTTL